MAESAERTVVQAETIGVVGGTGVDQLDRVTDIKRHAVNTPFGKPSSDVTEAKLGSQRILFLPRHGIRG